MKVVPDHAAGKAASSPLKKAMGNAKWLLISRVIQMGVGLLVNASVARHLGSTTFGLLSMAIAFTALFAPLSQLGLNSLISREIIRFPNRADELVSTALAMRLAAGLVCSLVGMGLIWGGNLLPQASAGVAAVMFVSMTLSAYQVLTYWFEAHTASNHSVKAGMAGMVVSSVVKLLLVLFNAPLMAFAWTYVAEVVIVSMLMRRTYLRLGGQFSLAKAKVSVARELLSSSWPLILSGVAEATNQKIDQVMLGMFSSSETVGEYAVAARLSEVWYFGATAIAASIYPRLMQLKNSNPAAYQERLRQGYDFLCSGAGLIALGTTFAAPWVIALLYGDAYRDSATILSIHIWASIFIYTRALTSKWLVMENILRFSLVSHLCGAVTNVILNLFLIPRYGGVGAAWATLISYSVSSVFAFAILERTRGQFLMIVQALVLPASVWRTIRTIRDLRNRKRTAN